MALEAAAAALAASTTSSRSREISPVESSKFRRLRDVASIYMCRVRMDFNV